MVNTRKRTIAFSGPMLSAIGALVSFLATLAMIALVHALAGCSPAEEPAGLAPNTTMPGSANDGDGGGGGGAGDGTGAATDAAGGFDLPTGVLNEGCAPDGGAGHQVVTCKDGTQFDIDVTDACSRGGCGVIFDVHGWSMTGPMENKHTRLVELAGPKGFIVVNPTAPGSPPSWTKGSPTSREFAFDETVWGFFEATMQRFAANRDKIHMTGFSQGGMMTFRFFFAHPDVFASIAPIAGMDGFLFPKNAFSGVELTNATPSKRIPILYTHGTKDRLLNFDRTAVPTRDEILKAYGLAGVTPETIKSEPAFRAQRWQSSNALFEFWDHDFSQGDIYIGGHCLSGPIKEGDGEFRKSEIPFRCLNDAKKPQAQYDLGMELLRFFEDHPKGK